MQIHVIWAVIVIGDAQALIEILESAHVYFAHVPAKSSRIGDVLNQVLVFFGRRLAKGSFEPHPNISAQKIRNVSLHGSRFIQLATEIESLFCPEGRQGRGVNKMRSRLTGYQQRLLIAQRRKEHSQG